MLHAVTFFEHAAQPDGGGRLEVGAADVQARQVLRFGDAGRRVHEDEAVAEAPVEEDRDRGEVFVAIAFHEIRADVDFADVELVAPGHAPVPFARTHAGERHEFDAVGLHRPERERPREFVVAERDREPDLCHYAAGLRRRAARSVPVAAAFSSPFAVTTTP